MHGMCTKDVVSPSKSEKICTLVRLREHVRRGASQGKVSSPTAEKVGGFREVSIEKKSPARAAAASAVAREQSQRSSVLPGLVSVTTISVLKSTYQLEPTWQLWSGPTSASYHFFFFFLWVREVALPPNPRNSLRGMWSPGPQSGELCQRRCPIIRHDLLPRALPTVTCRNLV